jgi:transketolase
VNPADPRDPSRDRVVLSKGHAAPMLYLALAEKGFFPFGEIDTLRDFETRLQGHPSSKDTPGVELSTGPLGLGLSAALGMALSLRLDGNPARVYAIIGDGEANEGTIWEAMMAAAKFKADNLTAILDWNGVQLDGTTADIMPTGDLGAKFASFGWNCIPCDGHDISALCGAYDAAAACKGAPSAIIAKTVKGRGVSFMEGQSKWHGNPISDADCQKAMAELGGV